MYDIIKIRKADAQENTVLIHALLLPGKNDVKPVWVNSCLITYNGDGTATLKTDCGCSTGRIDIDFLLLHGMNKNGSPNVSLLTRNEASYCNYVVCDIVGNIVGKLCDFYPA